jgi:cytochrome c biogenesis protein CcmG/thiol:disulfide interchange protein DsbE
MRHAVWAIVIAIPVVAVLAYGFGRNPDTIASPLIGKPAAAFSLRSLDGRGVVSLVKLRGHPVIVNFWASWCADCKIEHANLVAAWQQYGPAGVKFVGIDYQDSASDARQFMRQEGGRWSVVGDPSQRTAVDYGVYGVPETFFIDKRGIVRYKTIGPVSWTDLQTRIEHLVGRSA